MHSHTVSLDTCVCPYIDGAKWGYGDFLCGANWTFDITESELPDVHSATLLKGACCPCCHLVFAWAATGELQWSQHDCLKVGLSPCHGSLCKLPCSHETQSFVDYICAHHDQNCLGVSCGGENQQQHILIVAFYPQNLEVYLQKSEVWDGWTPIPSSSNNQPRGWICRVSSLQNCTLMLKTWAPESIKAVTSCPSIITGASLEHPIRCAMGSGLRNGTGATCCHPSSLLPSYGLVLDWGQGGNVVSLLTAWCRGFDCIPLVPLSLFNGFAGVAHSLAIWPQPWHLKHCRALESFVFWALPWAPVDAWVLPLLWEAVATLLAAEELWAELF